tara:strand:- start:89338 stop:89958 length:621 start_codon:yes stop_codon:yes gene_type:complete
MFYNAKLDKFSSCQYNLGYFRCINNKKVSMASILSFAGSNSSVSINFKLVQYTTSLIKDHKVQVLNLANYPFPMYSYDEEKNNGFINSLIEFKNDINKSNGLILSVNEHNSNPSAYFKNVLDWLSRVDKNFLSETKIFLMATSQGKRGGSSSLELIEKLLPRFGGEIVATFSLPSYGFNFDESKGITDNVLTQRHQEALQLFLAKL